MRKRKSVFVSYAHADGTNFTSRLVFALRMHMELFWDKKLEIGGLEDQLREQVKANDYLLYVMTPSSLKSKWCQQEIDFAKEFNKPIIRLRNPDGHGVVDDRFGDDLYCDFEADFEGGFRSLTKLIMGEAYSSWEILGYVNNEIVFDALQRGFIPGLIAKEISEWIAVRYLSNLLRTRASEVNIPVPLQMEPRTLIGLLSQATYLLKKIAQENDGIGAPLAVEVQQLIEPKIEIFNKTSDDEHTFLGKTAFDVIQETRSLLAKRETAKLDAYGLFYLQSGVYEFDIAEKLRELILMHSRRSRYLY